MRGLSWRGRLSRASASSRFDLLLPSISRTTFSTNSDSVQPLVLSSERGQFLEKSSLSQTFTLSLWLMPMQPSLTSKFRGCSPASSLKPCSARSSRCTPLRSPNSMSLSILGKCSVTTVIRLWSKQLSLDSSSARRRGTRCSAASSRLRSYCWSRGWVSSSESTARWCSLTSAPEGTWRMTLKAAQLFQSCHSDSPSKIFMPIYNNSSSGHLDSLQLNTASVAFSRVRRSLSRSSFFRPGEKARPTPCGSMVLSTLCTMSASRCSTVPSRGSSGSFWVRSEFHQTRTSLSWLRSIMESRTRKGLRQRASSSLKPRRDSSRMMRISSWTISSEQSLSRDLTRSRMSRALSSPPSQESVRGGLAMQSQRCSTLGVSSSLRSQPWQPARKFSGVRVAASRSYSLRSCRCLSSTTPGRELGSCSKSSGLYLPSTESWPPAPIQIQIVSDCMESAEQVSFRLLSNDRRIESMVDLLELKNIIARQLPKMPKEYIVKLLFDRKHESLVLLKPDSGRMVGGICYRVFQEQAFAEIAFLAVSNQFQYKGFGRLLMNKAKEVLQRKGLEFMVTYADNQAVEYFQKQGFSKEHQHPVERWKGYIKDYDGGTLMECSIHPFMDYSRVSEVIQAQRAFVLQQITHICNNQHLYTEHLEARAEPYRAGPLPEDVLRIDPSKVPGVLEAGWKEQHYQELKQAEEQSLQLQCQFVFDCLLRHKAIWPFRKPVTPEEAPDYHEVIKEPMDMSKIEERIRGGFYRDRWQFIGDVTLMLQNCKRFNLAETRFYKYAVELQEFVRPLFEGLMEPRRVLSEAEVLRPGAKRRHLQQ